jgi:hypothetical protein
MICGDAEITIGSTLTALMMSSASRNVINKVFVCATAPSNIIQGATLNRPTEDIYLNYYDDLQDLLVKLNSPNPPNQQYHLTLYFETVSKGIILDLVSFFKSATPILSAGNNKPRSITIMLDDRNGLGKIGPQSLGYLNAMEEQHGVNFLKDAVRKLNLPVQVIVAGSWFDAFGHQGGYVTGAAAVVENLTWDAKAYFFSTPPMPLQAAMSDRKLAILQGEISK